MALSLSTAEERGIASLSTTLLSPLDYESEAAWCTAVLAEAEALVGSDTGAIFVPLEDRLIVHTELDGAREYVPRARALDGGLKFLRRAVQLGAYDRATVFRPYLQQYLRSPYYNEWVVPNRLFDTIGLSVAPGKGVRVETVAQLFLCNYRRGDRLGARGPALLRLILPSFTAAVHAWRNHARQKAALPRALDRLREGLMICDHAGTAVHSNASLERALAADPEGPRIRARMQERARSLARYRRTPSSEPLLQAAEPLTTAQASYRIHVSCSESGELLPGGVIMVGLEKTSPAWPSEQDLVGRFRLPRAEARVALLLARGQTNAEIARELTVSPATARNHTARVREKLGVDTRAKVAAVLLRES